MRGPVQMVSASAATAIAVMPTARTRLVNRIDATEFIIRSNALFVCRFSGRLYIVPQDARECLTWKSMLCLLHAIRVTAPLKCPDDGAVRRAALATLRCHPRTRCALLRE